MPARFARTLVLIIALAGSASAGFAQPPEPPATPAAPAAEAAPSVAPTADPRLRARVEERYRVVTTRDGLVFVPRRARSDVRGVELIGDQVLVDGRPVSGAELRSRLGGDADVLLSLSYLPPSERLALFAPDMRTSTTDIGSPRERDRRVIRGERRGARIRIGTNLYVGEQERITDDAVAILGSIAIDGEVNGDVVAVGGAVRLGPKAVVRGEVTSVGGGIEKSPTAQVLGATNEVALAWPVEWDAAVGGAVPSLRVTPSRDWWAGFAFTATSIRLTVLGLIGLAAILIGGSLYRRAGVELSETPAQATLIGLAFQLLLVPALIVLCGALLVSVVGIPVLALVPVALLGLALLWVVGFAAVAERVGRRLLRTPPEVQVSVPAYIVGFLLLVAVLWASRLAFWSGAIGVGGALALGLIGTAIEGLAWAAGLGALVLAWLRRRSTSAVVPPIPATPVVDGPATL